MYIYIYTHVYHITNIYDDFQLYILSKDYKNIWT